MKSDIAVTKRAAHAAEEGIQRLEKEKQRQDFMIDGLQVRAAADATGCLLAVHCLCFAASCEPEAVSGAARNC